MDGITARRLEYTRKERRNGKTKVGGKDRFGYKEGQRGSKRVMEWE